MKSKFKNFCAALFLPVILLTHGCSNKEITAEEGKAWAEENGYIKKESNNGIYEFSHMIINYGANHDIYHDSCPNIEEFPSFASVCNSAKNANLEVISDTKIRFIFSGNTQNETVEFVEDENGYLIDIDNEGPFNDSRFLIRDNKVFVIGYVKINDTMDIPITIVFDK